MRLHIFCILVVILIPNISGFTCDSGDIYTTCNVNSIKVLDGYQRFNNLVVQAGGVITHSNNTDQQLYEIYIDANSLIVEAGGSIDATGKGYKGGNLTHVTGFGPGGGTGYGSSASYSGCGGSYGGIGGDGYNLESQSTSYGSYLWPTESGSGGGIVYSTGPYSPYCIGGNGGGSIILNVSGEIRINGAVTANGIMGGDNCGYSNGYGAGGGSGGSIQIIADMVTGDGLITADGGAGGHDSNHDGSGGGGGRIAVYSNNYQFAGNLTAYGGYGYHNAAAGTIYLKSSKTHLIVKNAYTASKLTHIQENDTINQLEISNLANVSIDGTLTVDELSLEKCSHIYVNKPMSLPSQRSLDISCPITVNPSAMIDWPQMQTLNISGELEIWYPLYMPNSVLNIKEGGVLTHTSNKDIWEYSLNLTFASIDIQGVINATGKGYKGGNLTHVTGFGPGGGTGYGSSARYSGCGGSYGGIGGDGYNLESQSTSYGSYLWPTESGSGGGIVYSTGPYSPYCIGGNGGGSIILNVSGEIRINGAVTANGIMGGDNCGYSNGYGAGGGSGGSVQIIAGMVTGDGLITADGGAGGHDSYHDGSGGGGGRIAVYSPQNLFNGTVHAEGGDFGYKLGKPGTIFFGTGFHNLNFTDIKLTNDIPIDTNLGMQQHALVDYNSLKKNYLIAYEDFSGASLDIYTIRLNPDASIIKTRQRIERAGSSTQQETELLGDIVHDTTHNKYLLLYHTATGDVYTELLNASGNVESDSLSATQSYSEINPRGVFNPIQNEFFIIWQDGRLATQYGYDLYAAILDSSGNVVTNNIRITDSPFYDIEPGVIYNENSDEYLIYWTRQNGDNQSLYYRRVSHTGYLIGGEVDITKGYYKDIGRADGMYEGKDGVFLITFDAIDTRLSNQLQSVYGVIVYANGTLLGTPFHIRSDKLGRNPKILFNEKKGLFMVTWIENGTEDDIKNRYVMPNGDIYTEDTVVTDTVTNNQVLCDVAYNPQRNEYITVWTDYRTADGNLYAKLMGTPNTAPKILNLPNLTVNESTAPPNRWLDFYKYTVDTENTYIIDDFNDRDYSLWTFNNVQSINETDSSISFSSTSNDPFMIFNNYDFPATDYSHFRVKAKIVGNGMAQLFWDRGNGFVQQDSAQVSLTGSDKWTTYLFNLTNVATWDGMIYRFRFDPIQYSGRTISLDSMAFLKTTNLSYNVIAQSNQMLIDCKVIDGHYLNCSTPGSGLFGYNDVTVQVSDGMLSTQNTLRITVNEINNPPVILVMKPLNDTDEVMSSVVLNYTSFDEETGIVYYYVYGGETFDNLTLLYQGNNPSYVWTDRVKDHDYYWQIKASDGTQNTTSPVYVFHRVNGPPYLTSFVPENNSEVHATYTWINVTAEDPDGDPIMGYYIYTGDSPDPTSMHPTQTGTYRWEGLSENTVYYWKVQVFDDSGLMSESPVYQFTSGPPPRGPIIDQLNHTPIHPSPDQTIVLYCTGNDDTDPQSSFKTEIQYKRPESDVWENCQFFGSLCTFEQYEPSNDRWYANLILDGSPSMIGNWSYRCRMNDTDGMTSGFVSASQDIEIKFPNVKPIFTIFNVQPTSPRTSDNLSCSWQFTDPDTSYLNFTYTWYQNGQVFRVGTVDYCMNGSMCNGSKILAVNTTTGDTWICAISAMDKYDMIELNGSVIIEQSTPLLSTMPQIYNSGMSAQTNAPYTNDIVECISGKYFDADGDAQQDTEYQWYVNGAVRDNETSTIMNLSKTGNGDSQDNILCSQRVFDGYTWSGWYNSSAVEVNGTFPLIQNFSISPEYGTLIESGNIINFTITATDADLQQYQMHICSLNTITSQGCTTNHSMCSSNMTASGTQAKCRFNSSSVTLEQNPGNVTFYVYACDTEGKCSNYPLSDNFLFLFTPRVDVIMSKGWNLVTLPYNAYEKNGSDKTINADQFLKIIDGEVLAFYNTSSDHYITHIRGSKINNFTINVTNAYYAYMNLSTIVSIRGKPVQNFTRELEPGWNFINYPTTRSMGQVQQEVPYLQDMVTYLPNKLVRPESQENMVPGYGIMVFVDKKGSIHFRP